MKMLHNMFVPWSGLDKTNQEKSGRSKEKIVFFFFHFNLLTILMNLFHY